MRGRTPAPWTRGDSKTPDLRPAEAARYQLRYKPIRREPGNRTPRVSVPSRARSPSRSLPIRPGWPASLQPAAGASYAIHCGVLNVSSAPPHQGDRSCYARAEGLEPSRAALETAMLPLHHAHMKLLPWNEKPPGSLCGAGGLRSVSDPHVRHPRPLPCPSGLLQWAADSRSMGSAAESTGNCRVCVAVHVLTVGLLVSGVLLRCHLRYVAEGRGDNGIPITSR